MLGFLARLRVIIFSFLLLSFAYSREDSFFTSSVTYCQPPETLLIQQFDLAYIASNQSIFFNISAASVEANVNVTANLLLNVYGLNPLNITLDLCNILGGVLCPLPMYNFTGSSSVSLPNSLGVSGKIPGIAFKVPDLEAFAQLTLTEVTTGNVKACVQATLSNGWSTHQPAVEWATGGTVLAALLLAAWQSLSPEAITPFRLLDLIYLYQSIASTSLLSLNYPSTYRAFTLNFSWAIGLFPTSSSSAVQSSINRMRHLTGGKLADAAAGSAVGFVNRKLSPYNVPSSNFLAFSANASSQRDVQTVTAASSNVLQAGIPIYVNSIQIAAANAFMSVFICGLVLVASAAGVFLLAYGVLFVMGRLMTKWDSRVMSGRIYRSFIYAWCFRLGLVVYFPFMIFIFYQWTLKDSWLSLLLSVIAFLAIISLVSYPAILTIRIARRSTSHALYADIEHFALKSALYAQYRIPRYYYFLLPIIASFCKAVCISFIYGNGEAQVILMVILEGVTVISYLALRPYNTRGDDVFSTFLAGVRLLCTSLTIAFVERLKLAPIPRVVIGLVIAVIFSIAIIITFVNLVVRSVIELWKHDRLRGPARGYSNGSMLEKGELHTSKYSDGTGRPINPTPERSFALDPGILQPYEISTTATDADQPSLCSRDSRTITIGSLLPRRWSFSPPNSPSPSLQSHERSSHTPHPSPTAAS